MNKIIESLYARKSVRVYTEEEITREDKEAVLNAALQAPSAGCQLLYTILDITDQDKKERLAKLCDDQAFIAKAKLVLVFCADCRKWLSFYREAGLTPRRPGAGDGGCGDRRPECGDSGRESRNRFLLHRRCDGECGRYEGAVGDSLICISGVYAGLRLSDRAAEGEEKAGEVRSFGYCM